MNKPLQALFVNRTQHLQAFKKMLSNNTNRRIMLFEEKAGAGKTWLLHVLAHEAKALGYSTVYLDFADRRAYDVLTLVRHFRDALNPLYFNKLTQTINASTDILSFRDISSNLPLEAINISIGDSNSLIDSDVTISDVGSTIVKDNYFFIQADSPQIRIGLEDRITSVFIDCLKDLSRTTKVVFLFDTYEHNSRKFDKWIPRTADRWIYSSLLTPIKEGILENVVVVLAGRRIRPFGRDWYHVLGYRSMTPLDINDVREYLRDRCGLSMLSDREIEIFHQATDGDPQLLGLLGDNLVRKNLPPPSDFDW